MNNRYVHDGVLLPTAEEVFVSAELAPEVSEAMENFTLKQIEENPQTREWIEEYVDLFFPIMPGICGNCSQYDAACRCIHITPGDVEKLLPPKFDLLCDPCFTAMRDINTARVCNDMNELSEATKRFTSRSGLFENLEVN